MAREIRVEILGDASRFTQATKEAEASSTQLESTWDRLQRGVDELGQSVDKLSDKVDDLDKTGEIADAFGNLERVFIGVGDQLGVLEEQFGVNLGPMREYTQAAADVAGGMEGIIGGGAALVGQFKMIAPSLGPAIGSTWAYVSALVAQTAAFIAANAPILIIIGSLVLLGAGIVALVKYWDDLKEKFPILQELEDKVTSVVDAVVPKLRAIWEQGLKPVIDFVQGNWQLIGAIILAPFAPLILIATDAFGIRSKFEEGVQGMVNKVEDGAGWIGHWLNVAGNAFSDFLNMAKGPIDTVLGWIDGLVGKIQGAIDLLGKLNPLNGSGSFNTGVADANFGSNKSNQVAGGGGGGSTGASSYVDPRGATLTADDILNMRAQNNGFVGATAMTVQILGDVYARDSNEKSLATGDLNFLTGLRAKGMN